jgi:hypothetical protein
LSQPNVVVRYDVTGSQVVVTENQKIAKSFDALRTSGGQVSSSIQQMQQGFRTDALAGFSTSVTNADTKITGFRAKLTQIGTAFSQNATSFGVATASIWGVYNAYDSLEKVQIRAHAAAQRVSTLETTIATLTLRRDQAVRRGNVSAEQLALLDDRITNAHNKLAVAQERNADLQQDVNEAWAAFASQVGPQAIAAGASIVQLVTNLRGSMTGIVPAIKGFFTSFVGGGNAINAASEAGLRNVTILKNMQTGMEGTKVATMGLSTAMKGLLIGGGIAAGIFAIGEAIAFFRDQEINAIIDSKGMNDAIAKSDEAFQDFEETSARAQKTLDVVVKGFGAGFQQLIDKAERLSAATNLASITTSIAREKDAIGDLTPQVNALKEKYVQITKEASFFDIISGKLADGQHKLEEEITKLVDAQNKHGENIKTNTELQERLRAAIALQGGTFDKDTEFILQAVAAGIKFADASQLLNVITEHGTKSLNDHAAAMLTYEEAAKTGKDSADNWLRSAEEKFNLEKAERAELLALAKVVGVTIDLQDKSNEEIKEAITNKLGWTKATKDQTNEQEQLNNKLTETWKAEDELNAEFGRQQNILDEVNRAFGTHFTVMNTDAEQIDKLHGLFVQQNADFLETENNLAELAATNHILTGSMLEMIQNREDDVEAMSKQITSAETLTQVFNDMERQNKSTWAGMVEGRMKIIDLIDSTDRAHAAHIQYTKDLQLVIGMAGVEFPAALEQSTENMDIFARATLGDVEAFKQLKEIMSSTVTEAFAPFDQALADLVDQFSDKEGKKDVNKFLDKFFPKDVKKELKLELDFRADEQKTKENLDKIIALITEPDPNNPTKIRLNATVDENDVKSMLEKWRKDIKKRMDEDELGPDSLSGIFLTKINQALDRIKNGENPLTVLTELLNDPALKKAMEAEGNSADNPFSAGVLAQIDALSVDEETKNKLRAVIQGLPGTEPIPIDIPIEPNIGVGGGKSGEGAKSEALDDIFRSDPEDPFGIKAIITEKYSDLEPIIVQVTANIEAFLKSASDVMGVTDAIDKLRPIVDFLGDHRAFMKAGADVVKVVQAIDKLRPIVDFMGDHSRSGNFMKAAKDVEDKIKDIDGTVVTVKFKGVRVGQWSAQHGMHATLVDDAVIYAHKGERVDIGPPPEHPSGGLSSASTSNHSVTNVAGPKIVHVEMPVYLFPGSGVLTKIIKEIPLEDTGMYASA